MTTATAVYLVVGALLALAFLVHTWRVGRRDPVGHVLLCAAALLWFWPALVLHIGRGYAREQQRARRARERHSW